MFRWSDYCIVVNKGRHAVLVKSLLTGAVVELSATDVKNIERLNSISCSKNWQKYAQLLDVENSILVPCELDEYGFWRYNLLEKRNNQAHIFTLYFLPTTKCQLDCSYCFERGITSRVAISSQIVSQSNLWLREYLTSHPEIDTLRLVFFGGEPLLQKKVVRAALVSFHSIAESFGLEFYSEIITNGEYLDDKISDFFAKHNWRRVQITLDGSKVVHDSRRFGAWKRPTFDTIIRNVKSVLAQKFINAVDLRISLDTETAASIPELISFLAGIPDKNRINLSLGLITPSLSVRPQQYSQEELAQMALTAWESAKQCGFKIPEDFVVGPWCVAIAKHSAVLYPDGSLQKCFCTAGRSEYNFGHIFSQPEGYTKDRRFEHFERTDKCLSEKCAFLPVCGGGCLHDSLVAHKGSAGLEKRFCQKKLVAAMNYGLFKLNYL